MRELGALARGEKEEENVEEASCSQQEEAILCLELGAETSLFDMDPSAVPLSVNCDAQCNCLYITKPVEQLGKDTTRTRTSSRRTSSPLEKLQQLSQIQRVAEAPTPPERNRLIKLDGRVGSSELTLLLDSGASQDFLAWSTARRLGLKHRAAEPMSVRLADGGLTTSTAVVDLDFTLAAFPTPLTQRRTLRLIQMSNLEAVLGMPWLTDVKPHIDFGSRRVMVTGMDGISRRLATRDSPPPTASLHSFAPELDSDSDSDPDDEEQPVKPQQRNKLRNVQQISHVEFAAELESGEHGFIAWIARGNKDGGAITDARNPDGTTMTDAHGATEPGHQFTLESAKYSKNGKGSRKRRRKARQRQAVSQGEGTTAVVNVLVQPILELRDEHPETFDVETAAAADDAEKGKLDEDMEAELERVCTPGTDEEKDFPEKFAKRLKEYIRANPELVALGENLGSTRKVPGIEVDHRIDEVPGSHPPSRPAFRMSAKEIESLKQQIDTLMENGFIRPSSSPYGAPVMFVSKPDGTLRFVIDYRALNSQTVKDKYNLPRAEDLFDQLELHGAKYISSIDLLYGYWQVHMRKEDIAKTAIRTPIGSFEFLVMPMGLCNAPATFQRMMEAILRPFLTKFAMVYLDDVIIYSKTAEEHEQHIIQVLEALNQHHLRIKLKKSEFFRKRMKFLGHIITVAESGIQLQANPEKVKLLREFQQLSSSKHVERFLGLANYYSRLIKDYAAIAAPLMSLSNQNFTGDEFQRRWKEKVWDEELKRERQPCQEAFETLKECLTSDPVVMLAKPDVPFIIQTDASDEALGGAIMQEHAPNTPPRVVLYFGHKFTKSERNWPVHERELYALVYCLRKFRHYLVGQRIQFVSDHKPIMWLKTQANLSQRQTRWLETLESFDWSFLYEKGKDLAVDVLSRPSGSTLSLLSALLDGNLPDDRDWQYREHGQYREDDDEEKFEASSVAGKLFTSGWLLRQLQTESLKDPELIKILNGENESQKYFPRDGVVYEYVSGKAFHRILVPAAARQIHEAILQEFHDGVVGGHLGADKTRERIERLFIWDTLRKDVDHWVKTCGPCRRGKHTTTKPAGHPTPYNIPDAPFHTIAMDLKTGLPTTAQGHTGYLVVVDKLTRYGHIIPVKSDVTAGKLAQVLFEHVIRRWGFPKTIISDRDPKFTAELWRSLWATVGTKENMTTAGRPQADGSSERYIKTISGLMKAHIAEQPDDTCWDRWIGALEFAYNDSVNASTGYTPFQLAIGRDPLLPIAVLMQGFAPPSPGQYTTLDGTVVDPTGYLQEYARKLSDAKERLQRVMHAQHVELMRRVSRPTPLKPGDYAWLRRTNVRGKPTAFEPHSDGPFEVVEVTGPNTYRLDVAQTRGGRQRHDVFNEDRLTPYIDRDTGLTVPKTSFTDPATSGPSVWKTESNRLQAREEARREDARRAAADLRDARRNSRQAPDGNAETVAAVDTSTVAAAVDEMIAGMETPASPTPFRQRRRARGRRKRLLEICAGPNKPAARALRRRHRDADITTVDIDPATFPSLVADITKWTQENLPWPPGYFDIIWASPPCTEYSRAKTVGVRNLGAADRIVDAVMRIIEHLKPRAWFIENPRGMLRDRPMMAALVHLRHTCTYCRYGAPYQKETDIWSNVPLRLLHCMDSPCAVKRACGYHLQTAQRGASAGGTVPGTKRHQAYEPPPALMDYLINAALTETYPDERDRSDWKLHLSRYTQLLQPFTSRRSDPRETWFELFSNDGNLISARGYSKTQDAFRYSWTGKDFYGNPVFNTKFITKTLRKALHDFDKSPSDTRFVFILPNWTTSPWFHLTRHFKTLQTYPRGTEMFSACLPHATPGWTPAGPEGGAGRSVKSGTPFEIIAVGIGRDISF